MSKPTAYELESYKWRKNSEAKDPNYCGSCSIEVHVEQVRNKMSWVSDSMIENWRKEYLADLQVKKMKDLNIPSDLAKCQLMILALTESLEQTAKGERSADMEVERLRNRLEVEQTCNRCGKYHGKEACQDLLNENALLIREMTGIDDKWYDRIREEHESFERRTRALRKQLQVAHELMVEWTSLQPPAPIVVKTGLGMLMESAYGRVATPHTEEPIHGCTWPTGNCQCMETAPRPVWMEKSDV